MRSLTSNNVREKFKICEDTYDNIAETESESPLSRNEEADMTANSLASFHSSLMNASTNLNTFPSNMLEVQRILATHMLMMEKHRRLFLPVSETEPETPIDKAMEKEADVTIDDSKREDPLKQFFNFETRSRNLSKNFVDSNSYRSSYQSPSKTFMEGEGKSHLEHAKCYLETKELWEKFHRLGTEMIITKTGR